MTARWAVPLDPEALDKRMKELEDRLSRMEGDTVDPEAVSEGMAQESDGTSEVVLSQCELQSAENAESARMWASRHHQALGALEKAHIELNLLRQALSHIHDVTAKEVAKMKHLLIDGVDGKKRDA